MSSEVDTLSVQFVTAVLTYVMLYSAISGRPCNRDLLQVGTLLWRSLWSSRITNYITLKLVSVWCVWMFLLRMATNGYAACVTDITWDRCRSFYVRLSPFSM